jgi:hypothetical protein
MKISNFAIAMVVFLVGSYGARADWFYTKGESGNYHWLNTDTGQTYSPKDHCTMVGHFWWTKSKSDKDGLCLSCPIGKIEKSNGDCVCPPGFNDLGKGKSCYCPTGQQAKFFKNKVAECVPEVAKQDAEKGGSKDVPKAPPCDPKKASCLDNQFTPKDAAEKSEGEKDAD